MRTARFCTGGIPYPSEGTRDLRFPTPLKEHGTKDTLPQKEHETRDTLLLPFEFLDVRLKDNNNKYLKNNIFYFKMPMILNDTKRKIAP